MERTEGLGSLDAARFRLPLLLAAQRLLDGLDARPLLVDARRPPAGGRRNIR